MGQDLDTFEQEIRVSLNTNNILSISIHDVHTLLRTIQHLRSEVRHKNDRIDKLEKVIDRVTIATVCGSCGWHLQK